MSRQTIDAIYRRVRQLRATVMRLMAEDATRHAALIESLHEEIAGNLEGARRLERLNQQSIALRAAKRSRQAQTEVQNHV